MDRNDQILAVSFFVLVCGIGLAGIAASHDRGNAAEWTGAVLAFGAIMAAIWTAGRSLREEKNRNDARGLVCAHKLAPHAIEINNKAKAIEAYAATQDHGIARMSDAGFPSNLIAVLSMPAPIPREKFDDAWALPLPLARHCLLMDSTSRQYHDFIQQMVPQLQQMTPDQLDRFRITMRVAINGVQRSSLEARKGLEKLLKEPLG